MMNAMVGIVTSSCTGLEPVPEAPGNFPGLMASHQPGEWDPMQDLFEDDWLADFGRGQSNAEAERLGRELQSYTSEPAFPVMVCHQYPSDPKTDADQLC